VFGRTQSIERDLLRSAAQGSTWQAEGFSILVILAVSMLPLSCVLPQARCLSVAGRRQADTPPSSSSHQGLHRISEDERTVKTAHLKPACHNGPYEAGGFQRTGTRRISSRPGENSPLKAGYIDADFPSFETFALHSASSSCWPRLRELSCRNPTLQAVQPPVADTPLEPSSGTHTAVKSSDR
jgi:hypothetical protein